MFIFNELRIDSSKNLIIDVSILDVEDDPNRLASIDNLFVGVSNKTDLINLPIVNNVSRVDYNTNVNLYVVKFTTSPNVSYNDVYSFTNDDTTYNFTVISWDISDNTVTLWCEYNKATTGLGTTGTLTKTSGASTSDATITYSSLTTSYPIRRRREIYDLTNSANEQIFGCEAYKHLIYIRASANTWNIPISCSISADAEGYVYNKCLLFEKIFNYIKDYNSSNNCNSNIDDYANYIVQVKGLEMAVESGNFILANKYWESFFSGNSATQLTRCCCHG